MFKKICNFIIMITCGINIISLFIYPVYEIQNIEILKSGDFVETLTECGFLEENNNSLSNDLYMSDLIKMFINYVKYDIEIFKTIELEGLFPKLFKLFEIWLNPLPLLLLLLVTFVIVITLSIVFIKSLIGNLTTYQPKIFLGLFESIFFVVCLINIASIIPSSYLENSQNLGSKGILTMLSYSKSSNALMIMFWGIIFSLWIGFAMKVFGEPIKKRV